LMSCERWFLQAPLAYFIPSLVHILGSRCSHCSLRGRSLSAVCARLSFHDVCGIFTLFIHHRAVVLTQRAPPHTHTLCDEMMADGFDGGAGDSGGNHDDAPTANRLPRRDSQGLPFSRSCTSSFKSTSAQIVLTATWRTCGSSPRPSAVITHPGLTSRASSSMSGLF